jgi:hypothetical protein
MSHGEMAQSLDRSGREGYHLSRLGVRIMRLMGFCILASAILLSASGRAFGDRRDGDTGGPDPVVRGEVVGGLTAEKIFALERRANTLDRLGLTERASGLRRTLKGLEEDGGPSPLAAGGVRVWDSPAAPEVRRSEPGSMVCSSPWAEDVIIYLGDYAYDGSIYGNSFAVDYDSSGNLFAAVGLADSTMHIFRSTDLGVTWTDEMTVTTGVPELQTQLDLVVSDDGDSTLLNLFYLYPGSGTLVDVKIDYTAWSTIGWTILEDTVNSYWVVQDHYWGIDYFLHTVYARYDTLYYTWSDDRGSTWYPPVEIGIGFGGPCIAYGGYSGEGNLYVSALWLPSEDTTSLWARKSTDYGSTWSMWQLLYSGGLDNNDVLEAVLASTHATVPSSQTVHALMSVNYHNSGDYNLWVRASTDGGAVWSSRPGIAFDSAKTEHLASIGVFRAEDDSTFCCAYYMVDTASGAADSLMYVMTTTDDWEADKPGYSVNDSAYAPGLRPQIAFAGGGLPGIAYAGSDGRNVYYDNIWFVGAQEGVEPRAARKAAMELSQNYPNPFTSRTSITYALPHGCRVSLHVYDAAGRLVRTLFDGLQSDQTHSAVWDGLDMWGGQAPAGVYIYRLRTDNGSLSRKLVLVR